MSTKFFQPFEKIYYKFGDEATNSLFQNLTQYVDIIDQIKSQQAFYEDYTIKSGDRPDTLSTQLYGDPKYYWTFFLLNDDLRESGWPLRNEEVLKATKEFYPHRVVTINSDISSSEGGYDFRVGRHVTGNTSGTFGDIIKRNLDLGQLIIDTQHSVEPIVEGSPELTYVLDVNSNGAAEIVVPGNVNMFHSTDLWVLYKYDLNNPDGDPQVLSAYNITLSEINTKATIRSIPFQPGNYEYRMVTKQNRVNPLESTFVDGEIIQFFDNTTGLPVQKFIAREDAQYNAVHHYENANGEFVDIDPYSSTIPSNLKPITNLSRVQKKNDDLKQIKVIKSEVVETVVKEFYRLMQQR
jgi:hypothetical protein